MTKKKAFEFLKTNGLRFEDGRAIYSQWKNDVFAGAKKAWHDYMSSETLWLRDAASCLVPIQGPQRALMIDMAKHGSLEALESLKDTLTQEELREIAREFNHQLVALTYEQVGVLFKIDTKNKFWENVFETTMSSMSYYPLKKDFAENLWQALKTPQTAPALSARAARAIKAPEKVTEAQLEAFSKALDMVFGHIIAKLEPLKPMTESQLGVNLVAGVDPLYGYAQMGSRTALIKLRDAQLLSPERLADLKSLHLYSDEMLGIKKEEPVDHDNQPREWPVDEHTGQSLRPTFEGEERSTGDEL